MILWTLSVRIFGVRDEEATNAEMDLLCLLAGANRLWTLVSVREPFVKVPETRKGGWSVRIEHPSGHCQAEIAMTPSAGTRRECFRSGMYVWRGRQFCYQHHPDWDAWYEQAQRIRAIAQAAIAQEKGPGE